MSNKYLHLKKSLFISVAIAVLSFSCGEEPKIDTDNAVNSDKVDLNNSQLLEIDGKMFSIPSPIQTAFLLKSTGTNYSKDMLNSPSKVTSYATNFKKAINLGVYGADLSYVTLYDQTQDAISYLTAINTIAEEIGVNNAFDVGLIKEFEKNIGDSDSLLDLVSTAFKSSDRFLKKDNQNDIGALILAGGWIESLYFTTNAANITNNQEIIKRIGEQKTTLYNLINLLMPFNQNQEFIPLINNLFDLYEEFEKIEFTYTYVEPTVDVESKTTTINSVTEVNISVEQLKSITEKISNLRADIID